MDLYKQSYPEIRAAALRRLFPENLDALKSAYHRGMALIWEVEGETGPQEVLDQFGASAGEVFARAFLLAEFIHEQDPDWTPPPAPFAYEINPDGTVTVGEKIPPPDPDPEPD